MKLTQYLIFAFFTFISLSTGAQNRSSADVKGSSVINLVKKGPHYVFKSKINNISDAIVLLESGIPAMLADSAYVFSTGLLGDIILDTPHGESINLGGSVYHITHKAHGVVRISDQISYEGDIFILSNYAKHYQLALPIQNLHNDMDKGSRIIQLSLSENTLKILSRRQLYKQRSSSVRYRMNTKSYMGMPSVETDILIDYSGKTRTLKGNFNIDFGNPELLFLMDQHADVQKFIKENSDINFREARNPRGDIIAQFMFADNCKICNVDFTDPVILITKALPRFTTTGNLGLKFFRSAEVVFDFDKNQMHILHAPTVL